MEDIEIGRKAAAVRLPRVLSGEERNRGWLGSSRAPFFEAVGRTQVRVIPGDPASSTEGRDLTTGKLLLAMSVECSAWQAFYPDTSGWIAVGMR